MPKDRKSQSRPLLGAHMSIAGGTPLAVDRARSIGATAMQIFVKNNNRWRGKEIGEPEIEAFRAALASSKLRSAFAHNAYLINLASPDPSLWKRSIEAMTDELERCRRLGLSHLVCHPGAHMGRGEGWGVRRVAKALDRIREIGRQGPVRIALETTAGQGNCLGHRFEHLREILAACRASDWIDVCADTCHLFAAGYDFRESDDYEAVISEFDRRVGLPKLRIFHLNDSRRELGSRVDRHEHIGRGRIGQSGFAWIMRDVRFRDVPKILETPKGKDLKEDRRNLRILRKLARSVSE